MEGKVLDDYLVVNVSKTSNEEIAIDGSIVVYRENDAFEVGIVWSKKNIWYVAGEARQSWIKPRFALSLVVVGNKNQMQDMWETCKPKKKVAHILKDNMKGACGFCGEKVNVGEDAT